MIRTWTAAALLVCLGACKKTPTEASGALEGTATPPVLLSVASPTKDEDPSALTAADGRLFVAWFSDRGGNNDIYIANSTDGTVWSNPVRVTDNPAGDFYPNLIQTSDGTFHLVWFQWVAFQVGQIRYSSSPDGITWASESAVTTDPLVDDWLPTMCQRGDGTLLVYFVSTKRGGNGTSDIYVASKPPNAEAWSPAAKVVGVSSSVEHDQLPFAVRTGNLITMTWVRHNTSDPDFITNPKSDLYLATSADGFDWSPPTKVTTEAGNVVNLFPEIYRRHDGTWSLAWLSTRGGSPAVYEIPLASANQYPAGGLTQNTRLPPGYSHRLVATAKADEYLAVWVQGPTGSQDIYYRFLTR